MIIVAGTGRVPRESIERWRAALAIVVAETRKEAGCRAYSVAEDVLEPGLMHTFEIWDTREHLDAHLRMPHLTAWRAAVAEAKVYDRVFHSYESAEGKPL